jgi:GNAT superfamily N-acetyltransferase
MVQIIRNYSISDSLKNIFWRVFFESKKRGVSLERHFPWLVDDNTQKVFLEARISSATVGGLVLRQQLYKVKDEIVSVGLVGLVCVEFEFRGNGVAAALLENAISYGNQNDFDYLTLWTSQHNLYAKHAFYLVDPWSYGWVKTDICSVPLNNDIDDSNISISENKTTSLPPYASASYNYVYRNLSFTTVKDELGDIVVNYTGDPMESSRLMIKSLPKRWRLNAVRNDAIISALAGYGTDLKLMPANLQMWCNLDRSRNRNILNNDVVIPVLNRI